MFNDKNMNMNGFIQGKKKYSNMKMKMKKKKKKIKIFRILKI